MPEVTINYLAVLLASIAYMVIGMLWYGPLFGKQWKAIMGFTDEDMKNMPLTPIQAIIGGFISSLIMAYVLSVDGFAWRHFFNGEVSTALMAFNLGMWSWLGYIAMIQLNSVLWEGRPWKLYFINVSNTFVAFMAMAFIITYLSV